VKGGWSPRHTGIGSCCAQAPFGRWRARANASWRWSHAERDVRRASNEGWRRGGGAWARGARLARMRETVLATVESEAGRIGVEAREEAGERCLLGQVRHQRLLPFQPLEQMHARARDQSERQLEVLARRYGSDAVLHEDRVARIHCGLVRVAAAAAAAAAAAQEQNHAIRFPPKHRGPHYAPAQVAQELEHQRVLRRRGDGGLGGSSLLGGEQFALVREHPHVLGNPRVLAKLCHRHAEVWVSSEQFAHHALGRAGDVLPVGRRHAEAATAYFAHEHLDGLLLVKRRSAAQHHV